MCGRAYITYSREELWERYIKTGSVAFPHILSQYNIAPSQKMPVLRIKNEEKQFDSLQWGIVLNSSKTNATYMLINSRAETLIESSRFRNILIRQRCIIPLSGFYEWKREGTGKRPFCIFLKTHNIMSVAGICDISISKEGQAIESFSIITKPANALVGRIHHRMPCILEEKDEASWLDPECHDLRYLASLLQPCSENGLAFYEVSSLVNSPKQNSLELLKPISRNDI
jgi:putative SOS response-associated peptidase YedK